MPNGSHEIIDDFELDMDIETITLDDIDLREFEEPLPAEFASTPSSMDVGSIGTIENIQINTASFGGGMGRGQGSDATSEAQAADSPFSDPLSGGFSVQPEDITISAPSITIQTDSFTFAPPSMDTHSATRAPANEAATFAPEVAIPQQQDQPVQDVLSGYAEAPAIESLNIDELEFDGDAPSMEAKDVPLSAEAPLEIPTIAKEETLHLLAEEEPPLQAEIPTRDATPLRESIEPPSVESTHTIDENEEIISISGDELDKFLCNSDTLHGIEIMDEEIGEHITLPPPQEDKEEILLSPETIGTVSIEPPVTIVKSKNNVPIEENFELIIEDAKTPPLEAIYTSEPTEVLRESVSAPDKEPTVPLPNLEALDEVISFTEETPVISPPSFEAEDISLEPISIEEENIATHFPEEETIEILEVPESSDIAFIESSPEVFETMEAPLISDISQEFSTQQVEPPPFQFDLSAIPDLQPPTEDENEPIALSLEELNNIDVTESPTMQLEAHPQPIEEEGIHEIASVMPSDLDDVASLQSFDIPIESEVPLSHESFESIIAEEEKSDTIKQQDLNQLIEIAEPDIEGNEDFLETFEQTDDTPLPPPEAAETVEVSFDDIGIESSSEEEPVLTEAYMEESIPEETDRRQVIDNNIDTLSGGSREELRKVIHYLDNLLSDLPEEKIKEFAQSEYYDIYMKIMQKLGL